MMPLVKAVVRHRKEAAGGADPHTRHPLTVAAAIMSVYLLATGVVTIRCTLDPKSSAGSSAPEVPVAGGQELPRRCRRRLRKTTTRRPLPEICQKLRYT
jgi:hypothetical protein